MVAGFGVLRIVVTVTILAGLGYLFRLGTPGRWYETLSDRFLYGVPWGSLVTVLGVIAFYLFAQSGLTHWNSPVVFAFRSWSFLYPEGLLAAGFAHASPNHLIGNMVGTIVLAPIVEYAWGHFPPEKEMAEYEYPPPGRVETETVQPDRNGWRHNPWIRALVIFPFGVIVVSLVTSVLALGWSLGFSGTVYAFGGFAVVYFPVTAVFAMVGFTGTSIFVSVLREPVLRATTAAGPSGPPSWWGINVQAHMLGFLIGVILALALLAFRSERRNPTRVFLATLVFGLTRQLWSLPVSGGDGVFVQQRGIGLVFVVVLTTLISAIVAASDAPVPAPLAGVSVIPDRGRLAVLWLGAVGVVAGYLFVQIGRSGTDLFGGALFAVALVILVLPALPVVLPDRVATTPVSQQQLLVFVLVAVTLIIAVPSFATNAPGMTDDPLAGAETVTVEHYQITYAEDVPHGRIPGNESGVIVVSERRGIWSTATEKNQLDRSGESTIVVGGFGWRETVRANRTGWDVEGGGAAYVVDLEYAGTEKRLFVSGEATARARITNHTVSIQPDGDQFSVRATRNSELVGTTPLPDRNETRTLESIQISTELDGGSVSVFAEQNGTRVLIATRE